METDAVREIYDIYGEPPAGHWVGVAWRTPKTDAELARGEKRIKVALQKGSKEIRRRPDYGGTVGGCGAH